MPEQGFPEEIALPRKVLKLSQASARAAAAEQAGGAAGGAGGAGGGGAAGATGVTGAAVPGSLPAAMLPTVAVNPKGCQTLREGEGAAFRCAPHSSAGSRLQV
jgi:hypothetical protein